MNSTRRLKANLPKRLKRQITTNPTIPISIGLTDLSQIVSVRAMQTRLRSTVFLIENVDIVASVSAPISSITRIAGEYDSCCPLQLLSQGL